MYELISAKIIFFISFVFVDAGVFDTTESTTLGPRIIGGQKAEPGLLPYQVSVQFAANNLHYCAGTIISDRHVLSAAHCFPYFDAEDIQVWVGGRNLSNLDEGVFVDVEELFLHEYDEIVGRENDIAILKLKDKLNFTDTVQKIPLNKDDIEIGTECVVSGWGLTQDKLDQMHSEDLMYVNVFLLDRKICKESYGKLKRPVNVTESMICAGHLNGTKDACKGDSGGPLVCDNKLTGVVSFGAGCGLRDYPGVYTDPRFFLEWIENILTGNVGVRATSIYYLNIIFTFVLLAKNIL